MHCGVQQFCSQPKLPAGLTLALLAGGGSLCSSSHTRGTPSAVACRACPCFPLALGTGRRLAGCFQVEARRHDCRRSHTRTCKRVEACSEMMSAGSMSHSAQNKPNRFQCPRHVSAGCWHVASRGCFMLTLTTSCRSRGTSHTSCAEASRTWHCGWHTAGSGNKTASGIVNRHALPLDGEAHANPVCQLPQKHN
jgi:hypothetical protein